MQNQQVCAQDISSQPLVSFVVTTYDLPSGLLRECLGSILDLSLSASEREIILVDDGSAEPAINGLSDLKDCFVYLRQRNQGPSVARNHALGIARGRYIQFVDGDDYLFPHVYEHCLDLVRFEEPDVVHFEMTSAEGKSAHPTTKHEGPKEGYRYMLSRNIHGSACSYVFRTSILGSLRFTPGIMHEDEEFTPLLLLRARTVVSVDDTAYFYRQREGSRSNSEGGEKHVEKSLSDNEGVLFRLQSMALSIPELERTALDRRIAQLTMDYLYRVAGLTGNIDRLNEAIERLEERALYPLPAKKYTAKYVLFRKLVATAPGRRALVGMAKRLKG